MTASGPIFGLNLVKAKYATTGTANQAELKGYFANPGKGSCFATQSVVNYGVATDVGNITGKIQYSATTVASDFADITGAAFTAEAASDVAGFQQIEFAIPGTANSLRYVGTVAGGTPGLAVACAVFLVKRGS
jgi:hypothetical protein